jgi:hypothetical protein
MPGSTSNYGFPFQTTGDAPNGPTLGQDLAEAVDAELARVEEALGEGVALHIRTVAGSADFVKPADPPARFHWVRVWGAGAAGGGVVGGSGQGEGAGGGGGEYREQWYTDAELAASEPYTVGAGGAAVSGGNGGSGGDTTFADLIAKGGSGGQSMTATTTNAGAARGAGGAGGAGGSLVCRGGDGGPGRVLAGQAVFNGAGGASPHGGGAKNFPNFGAGPGAAGNSPGGGGSGAFGSTTSQPGGAGADGKILIVSVF